MTRQDNEVAAGAIVKGRAWLEKLHGELRGLLAPVFAQARSRFTAFAYVGALLAERGDRKSCWQLAEAAGHATPRRMQALLAEYAWDWTAALAALQRFIAVHLGDPEAIVVLDETAELKKGDHYGRGRPPACRDHRPGGELPDRRVHGVRDRPCPCAVRFPALPAEAVVAGRQAAGAGARPGRDGVHHQARAGHRDAHQRGERGRPVRLGDWKSAYELVGSVMTAAAAADEELRPPWWRGTVVASERKAFDISVLLVRPEPHMDYLPGQSVAIECPSRPKLWRYYSMANAPRPDGLLEFHIRLIDGGAVSMALTSSTIADTELRLGPPVGALTLSQPLAGRDLLLVAGSTGLAPLKAIIDQVVALQQPPKVHLFFGARTADGLYDLDSLEKIAVQHPWLTVTPAVSADSKFGGETGSLPDVVARHGDWSSRDAYLAGPTEMVQEAVARLASAGMPQDQIHIEDFGWSEP